MCSHLAKRVRALFSSSCFYSSPPRYQILTPLLFASFSTQTQTPLQAQKELPFIAQHLISSFGFSPDRALKVSADPLASIKSSARPEAVVKFLSDTGLTDAQIKAVVKFLPKILVYNVDKTFKPKVRELINAGCSKELLVQLIRYNPNVLYLNGNLTRLLFWRDFIGKDDQALLRIIERNGLLMTYSIDNHVLPRINLLKEYGMSNRDMLLLLSDGTRCMSQNLDSLRRTLELIEELGILRGSKKFRHAVKAVGGLSEDKIKRRVEVFSKTYGWSKEEVCSIFTNNPKVLAYSEENLMAKMNFLIGKARIEPSSIASYPAIFGYNLQRVLLARYNVWIALKTKGLEMKHGFLSACHLSEKRFRQNYVVPFEKVVPGLGETYAAALVEEVAKV